ncbi:MAG: signal peptidase I [Ruminococcus sp.]|nr:signal peptidase I [Ruminococcus sp.]
MKNNEAQRYTTEEIAEELGRVRYKGGYRWALRSTIYTLVIAAALAVLVATLWMPVLRIYGSSMTPTLMNNEIVLSVKGGEFKRGDICAMYYNNKVLVKRIVGCPGEWVNIDKDGNVFINGTLLDEPYVQEKALGDCDIELPFQVPEDHYFVMGDDRPVSVDSRHESIGAVAVDQIIGKIMCRLWPLDKIGTVE